MCIPASLSRTTWAVAESKIRLLIALRFPLVKVAFHIVREVQTEGIRSHCRFRHLWTEVEGAIWLPTWPERCHVGPSLCRKNQAATSKLLAADHSETSQCSLILAMTAMSLHHSIEIEHDAWIEMINSKHNHPLPKMTDGEGKGQILEHNEGPGGGSKLD